MYPKQLLAILSILVLAPLDLEASQQFRLFGAQEAGIADIHAAMEAGRLSCQDLVQMYLDRIDAYDKKGPRLNALVIVNPEALSVARELDERFAQGRMTGPLHCIPVIVKDSYGTADLPTTAGSLSLKGSLPQDDAFQVRKLREAGAIVLAKSNMAEFGFSPYHTVGSMLPGHTRNPYSLYRVPAGSSGGTAAAIAANFGTVGLGTDTGNSIRGPSSHTSLVGIRSTFGLTSRDGIVPLNLDRDIGGPMARSVADVVAILDIIAGYDPADPITEASQNRKAGSYARFLDRDGLEGARIGVVRQLFDVETADPDVVQLMELALADMKAQGATIIDPVVIPALDEIPSSSLWCNRFKFDINQYLASLGPGAPVSTLEEIIESEDFHPSIRERLVEAQAVELPPAEEAECQKAQQAAGRLRDSVRKTLSDRQLSALVYPTWSNPPRLIGDLNSPHGNNSPRLAPPTGFPAITVPMGFVRGELPAGLQFLGEAWSEPTLVRLAYAYEQATQHRRPPKSTPPLH